MANVHVYLQPGAPGERQEAHAESVLFLLAPYGVVYWEAGVGQ